MCPLLGAGSSCLLAVNRGSLDGADAFVRFLLNLPEVRLYYHAFRDISHIMELANNSVASSRMRGLNRCVVLAKMTVYR